MRKILLALLALAGLSCGDPRDTYNFGGNSTEVPKIYINLFLGLDKDGDAVIGGTFEQGCNSLANEVERLNCRTQLGEGNLTQTSSAPLRQGDCNDYDKDIWPGAPELCDGKDNQCPGDSGYGQIDEGVVCECWEDSQCNDGVFCNGVETCDQASHTCQPGTTSCTADKICDEEHDQCVECRQDADCGGGRCIGNSCVECFDHSDCDDGLFCNGPALCLSNFTCLRGPPPCDGLYCDEAADQCVECRQDADCSGGVCENNTCHECRDDTQCNGGACVEGACVECRDDIQCDDGLFCNGTETCDQVSHQCHSDTPNCAGQTCDETGDRCVGCLQGSDCPNGRLCVNNTCTECVTDSDCPNHGVCTNSVCEECRQDSDCNSSRPAQLPANYLWGCSTATVSPKNVHVCTSCLDNDHELWCADTEKCQNGMDDDGDGAVDEEPCEEVCMVSGGAKIRGIYGSWRVRLGALDIHWQSVPEPSARTFGLGDEYSKLGCYVGVYVYLNQEYSGKTWAQMTDPERQSFCSIKFKCMNALGQEMSPVVSQTVPEHPCLCLYNGVP